MANWILKKKQPLKTIFGNDSGTLIFNGSSGVVISPETNFTSVLYNIGFDLELYKQYSFEIVIRCKTENGTVSPFSYFSISPFISIDYIPGQDYIRATEINANNLTLPSFGNGEFIENRYTVNITTEDSRSRYISIWGNSNEADDTITIIVDSLTIV